VCVCTCIYYSGRKIRVYIQNRMGYCVVMGVLLKKLGRIYDEGGLFFGEGEVELLDI